MIFQKGGNAVDAACAMIAATSTMWDTLSLGRRDAGAHLQPAHGKVIGINALGVAPTGATPEFFKSKGMTYPPEFGPLAAVTPGTPGGLMAMLAEYGKLSLAEVLAPAIEMADGYPIEAQLVGHDRALQKDQICAVAGFEARTFLVARTGKRNGAARARRDLPAAGSRRDAAQAGRGGAAGAASAGKSRKEAIYGRLRPLLQGRHRAGVRRAARRKPAGCITAEDLANWKVHIEEPVQHQLQGHRGLQARRIWVQGPAMLQTLNILENFDLKAMGYNSARYIHTLYQAMNLAFADRDFYYGDPRLPPEEPIRACCRRSTRARARS